MFIVFVSVDTFQRGLADAKVDTADIFETVSLGAQRENALLGKLAVHGPTLSRLDGHLKRKRDGPTTKGKPHTASADVKGVQPL
ncbi:hypothetical protein BV898_09579 [Hypsibius exemplaris]|uniref:Uncharacterized protein n=1 Tax=Hypsibius exemplaris TaxID=2072580 RepID=A0A1W0WM31_HYPEX|nr:hypothetical protein BV898_09579 [Hypsibius exemplaris]